MAEPKKPNFPSKPCPKCGAFIHIKKMSHECGWNGAAAAPAPVVKEGPAKKKPGRPKKATPSAVAGSEISLEDIRAVKSLVDQLGAEKVRQLASVLG